MSRVKKIVRILLQAEFEGIGWTKDPVYSCLRWSLWTFGCGGKAHARWIGHKHDMDNSVYLLSIKVYPIQLVEKLEKKTLSVSSMR